MFIAQLRNKLTRQEEQMEDLLTSNVFGLWRYLSPDLGLLQFLETARRLDGRRLPLLPHITEAKLDFWPWLQEADWKGAEPDVLLNLASSDGPEGLVLVEAKYFSGKSSVATREGLPNDQLAREMLNLRQIARRHAVDTYALVYVTADVGLPTSDLEDAIAELDEKTGDSSAEHFYWASWRNLPQILVEAQFSARSPVEKSLLEDLGVILDRLGLTHFRGITSQGWSCGKPQGSFRRRQPRFEWLPIPLPHYNFQLAPTTFVWSRGEFSATAIWRWNSDQ